MPTYLDKEVSDEYLQGLIGAYRDGYAKAGGANVEDGDQPIIDELEEHGIRTELGARELGEAKAKSEEA